AVAVDTESHVAARIAAAHRIPFAACRAVIDPAHSVLPPAAMYGLRHDGTADVLAVLRSVVRQPSQLPALTRTALDARVAAGALRRGRRLLGAGLGFPYFSEPALTVRLPAEVGCAPAARYPPCRRASTLLRRDVGANHLARTPISTPTRRANSAGARIAYCLCPA